LVKTPTEFVCDETTVEPDKKMANNICFIRNDLLQKDILFK
jgi:hypothetical protein